jgi:nuclease S1
MTKARAATSVAAAVAIISFTLATTEVAAWGIQGHRLVALLAVEHLTPTARQYVAWLIGPETLPDVASWADGYLQGNFQTSFWHYVNIPADAPSYDRDRDCPRQPGVATGSSADRWRDCVVDRIPYHEERLANMALDRADRAIALKFLVHFVGDLHQPYHALGVERGGNGILVSVFGRSECGSDPARPSPCNLHSVWDSALIAHRQLDDGAYLRVLRELVRKNGWTTDSPGSAVDWAMQSKRIARPALLAQQGIVDEAYYRAHIGDIDQRLAQGGLRLAALLNRSLKSSPPHQ